MQAKFEQEKLELVAEYSQSILQLQKELLSYQQINYDLTALGTVQLLQARGIVIGSCKRCLGLLIPCRHVRPVERDDRIVQVGIDEENIYPEVLANHQDLISSPTGLRRDPGLSNLIRHETHEIRDSQPEVQVVENEQNQLRERRDTSSTRATRGCRPRPEILRTPNSSENGSDDRQRL